MPHSILSTTSSSLAPSREDRNRETALYHAHILQQRKDVEALILASTEALLDLPSSTEADSARPSSQDVSLVKDFLKPFQPSDYDALIEERNINKRCGYVLCPKPNRQEDTKAKYRILHGQGKSFDNFKFVERRTLERWCSGGCGKRALYIKVQLNEEPAWTRVGSSGRDISFLVNEQNDQKQHDDESTPIGKLRFLDMGLEGDEVVARMKALAIERGDEKAPSRSDRLAEIDIRENRNLNGKASAPEHQDNSERSSGTIEGYLPKFSTKRRTECQFDDGDGDIIPTI